jgi:hypothetical protein
VKLWPFVVVLVSLVLAGTVYILVREPEPGGFNPEGRKLPRLPVDRIEAPLPPRFAGPLPTSVEGFQHELEKGPPLSYMRARLLEGDREMGAKLLAALRQTAASAQSLEELWLTYGVVLGLGDHRQLREDNLSEDMLFLQEFQDEGVPCAWLRDWMEETPMEAPLLSELRWRKLVRCPGAETTALFAREDAPVQWVLDHYFLFDHPRITPALEKAVRRILDQNQFALFESAKASVSTSQEPLARELHEEIWQRASNEMRAEWEEKAARDELQRRNEEAHPWKCPPIPTRPEGVDFVTVNGCLEEWATRSWAEAARFATIASRLPEFQLLSGGLGTLRNFPSVAAMKAWARERKLLPDAAAQQEEPHSLYLSSIMRQARRAFSIKLRTSTFPRQHDDLLVTLAWVVRPALAGVVFEQLPPDSPPALFFEPRSREVYTLRAYADGHRFSIQAQNSHSLDDIGAVIGLLNQVLEARGSSDRLAVLDTSDSEVQVVLGPEAALREADARGLWRLGDGMQVLNQAEAQIEESLRYLLGEKPF